MARDWLFVDRSDKATEHGLPASVQFYRILCAIGIG